MTTGTNKQNNCSNRVLSNYNFFLPTACIEKQNISVNSPSHLNGSVTTVQKSSILTPVVTSLSYSENSLFPSINFDKVLLSPPTSYVKSETENSGKILGPVSQENNGTALNPELLSENSKPFTCETLNNFSTLDTVVRLDPKVFSVFVNVPEEVSANSTSTFSDSYSNEESTEPVIIECGHSIVSTGLQSGAYVSMYPFTQPNETPLYLSDSQSTLFSPEEVKEVKEEPQDFVENNVQESKNYEMPSNRSPSVEPIIVAVSSLHENGERIDMLNMKNDSKGYGLENDTDEDCQYLMSLLPKLKQLPKGLKRKFKNAVLNRLNSALIRANKKKRRKASESG